MEDFIQNFKSLLRDKGSNFHPLVVLQSMDRSEIEAVLPTSG